MVTGTVAWLAFGLRYAPVLYSDDWAYIIDQYVYGNVQWFDWTNRRPFLEAPLLVLTGLFGLNINAFYLVIIALQVLASLLLYWLLRRLGIGPRVFAAGVSLLFLLYPADYTHMWLTMVGGWVVINLLLAYAHLLLSYANTGAAWSLLASCTLLLVSLGIYEAQLGLAMAWCVLLTVVKRQVSWRRRSALLSPLGVGIVFAIWRMVSLNQRGVSDPLAGQMQFSPVVLLQRLVLGSKVLIWAWTEPVRQVMGFESTFLALLIMLLAISVAGLLGFLIVYRLRRVKDGDTAPQRSVRAVRQLAALLIAAVFLAMAGYFPVITVGEPNLAMLGSRINLFAIPGASLALISLLAMGILLISWNRREARYVLAAVMMPLLAIGVHTQASVQYEARRAWIEQKQIWQQLFALAPDFADGTKIYFVLHGYEDRMDYVTWQRPPLSAQWEVDSALKVLYNNQDIAGDMMITGIPPRLPENWITFDLQGITSRYSGSVTEYDKAVFFAYDAVPGRLRLVKDLSAELALPWQTDTYAPEQRILDGPAREFSWRSLVGM